MTIATHHAGDFLLEVAELGIQPNKSLTKFITYRKVQDHRLENLYSTLSITTGCLSELGTTLNKYGAYWQIKDDATRTVAETCKSNFEKVLASKGEGSIGGQHVTTKVDPWLLITISIGGTFNIPFYLTYSPRSRSVSTHLQSGVFTTQLSHFKDYSRLSRHSSNTNANIMNRSRRGKDILEELGCYEGCPC
jgi:hypothetical protein